MAVHITNEQKEIANQTDLVDYLHSKGYEMVKRGNSYKIKVAKEFPGDMSSVSIFENRRGWKRWSSGAHGGDAISFLQQNMGMTFQDAVVELLGSQGISVDDKSATKPDIPKPQPHIEPKQEPIAAKPFKLPEPCQGKCSRLFAYLTQTRKIKPEIVTQLLKDKKLYQDVRGNVVFVGYDEQHQARFGCVRGTNTDRPFKGDCDGSDKRYAFSVDGTDRQTLFIFEAPIDLLSHATLSDMTVGDGRWKLHNRLCLAGTSDVALEQYLKTHPQITKLHFVLDNDAAGQTAAAAHCKKYAALGYETHNHHPKHKDMNEDLVAYVTKKPPPSAAQKQGSIKR